MSNHINEIEVNVPVIADMGMDTRQVFVYDMNGMKVDDGPSFGSNTVSMVSITPFNGENSGMIEQDGYWTFEALLAETSQTVNEVNSNTQLFGSSTSVIKNLSGVTNEFVLGNDTVPKVCFLDRPYNENDFNDGKQIAYFLKVDNTIDKDDLAFKFEKLNITDPETYAEVTFVDYRTIEQESINSKIIFYENHNGYIQNPTVKVGQLTVPGFTLTMNSNSLLGSVVGKGHNNAMDSGIKLTSIGSLVPIRMSPKDTQEKVTMLVDWFDYGTYMPYAEAILFIDDKNPVDLSKYLDTASYNLIADLIVINYLFNSQFSGVNRIDSTGTKEANALGQIDSKQTLGASKLNILEMSSKNEFQVSDSRWKSFLSQNPNYDKSKLMQLKRIIMGLSRFVSSSFAASMGNSLAVAGIAPWYLTLSGAVELTQPSGSTNFVLKDTLKAFLESEYFLIQRPDSTTTPATVGAIEVKTIVDLDELKYVDTDQKMYLPRVPETLSAVDKSTLPGNMLAKNDNALKYMWYLPVNGNEAFQELYGNQPGTPGSDEWDQEFDLPIKGYGHYYDKTKLPATIEAYARATYAPNAKKIDVTRVGARVTVLSGIRHFKKYGIEMPGAGKDPWDPTGELYKTFPYTSNFLSKFYPMVNKGSKPWIEKFVHQNYKLLGMGDIDLSTLTINDIGGSEYSYYMSTDVIWIRLVFSYTLGSDKYVNNIVHITGAPKPVFADDRNVLYDKHQWKSMLQKSRIIAQHDYDVTVLSDYEIDKLDTVTIVALWGDYVIMDVTGYKFKIPCYNKLDETVTGMRIQFT